MPYSREKPTKAPSAESLRARIPGWGVDRDPKDRPSVPRERFDLDATGVHWDVPARQEEKWPRERSIEHEMLTPVFGTSAPPRLLSGAIRKLAYRRYSEARAAHWLLLLLGDRVDAWEHHLESFLTLRPDNPVTQTGVRSELTHHGISSRLGQKRADLSHLPLDPIIVAGPWLAAGVAAYRGIKRIRRAGASRA